MISSRYVTAPTWVASCDFGHVTVLVNYRSGGVHTVSGASARWWAEVAATGDTRATTALAPQSAAQLVTQLHAAGLLTDSTRPEPWTAPSNGSSWQLVFGTEEAAAAYTPAPHTPRRLTCGAVLVLVVTLAVQHLGPSRTGLWRLSRLLDWASRRMVRPASLEQVEQAIHAVRRAGLLFPGRVACLEESVAAVLVLAAWRRGVRWCHGIAADPIRLHAWLESPDGDPAAEPPSTRRYSILRTIPEQRTQGGDPL